MFHHSKSLFFGDNGSDIVCHDLVDEFFTSTNTMIIEDNNVRKSFGRTIAPKSFDLMAEAVLSNG